MICLLKSYFLNLCLYSGDPDIGYVMLYKKTFINIHKSSLLKVQGITPKWIICTEIEKTYCVWAKLVNEVTLL